MLASSSKHSLNVCGRATLRRQGTSVASASWLVPSIPGTRNVVTETRALHQNPQKSLSPSSQIWEFRRDDSFKLKRGAQSTEYNMIMRDFLSKGQIEQVVDLVWKMKRTNIRPDISTYNNLIHALSLDYQYKACWAVYYDMLAADMKPDILTFNHLLYAHRKDQSDHIFRVLDEMEKHDVQPSTRTYDFIIGYYLECDNLEMALVKLAEMNDSGFSPSLRVVHHLTDTAGRFGHVRLALDLADAYEATTVRRLDSETWIHLLAYCAEQLYVDGVLQCWKKVVTDLQVRVHEGLCQLVLHTAARHGLPTLASEAIQQLEIIGVNFQEYHFTPMLDAFVNNQQLKEAFCVLDLMRTAKTDPTIDSAYSILHAIRWDPEKIDNAYVQLEEIHKAGQKVDVIAVNILIKAAGLLNDLQRVVGIYKAMPSLEVSPDSETFEMLLKACRKARHIELGERLFAEIRESDLKPTARTYEALISLILTQTDYENAFFYLEDMKGAGFTPSYSIYEDIVRKCVSDNDTRYKLAIQELQQMGYSVSGRLRHFINTGGREWTEQLSEAERLPYETRKRMKELKEDANEQLL